MTPAREVDWRRVTYGVLLGLLGTALAIAFKARCGIPAGLDDAFLRACYSDIPPLYHGHLLDQGAVPYLDSRVEYPPLTGLWMWLAALGTRTSSAFFVNTAALLLLSGGLVGGLLAATVGLRRTLVFAAMPTLWVSGAINWDLPAIALATGGLVAHRRGRDGWAGIWIGLGTAAKLWPGLLLLPVALAARALRGDRAAGAAVGGAAAAWLAVNVPVAVVAPVGWLRFLELSRERGATTSSLWRLVPDLLGSEVSVAAMNVGSAALTLLGTVAVLWFAVRRDDPRDWHLAALPLVALFVLAGKVYSPQFSTWLLPLLALATPPGWALAAFTTADVAVNLTLFPHIGQFSGVEQVVSVGPVNLASAVRAPLVALVALWGWRRQANRRSAEEVGP